MLISWAEGLGREINGVNQNGEKEKIKAAEKEPTTTSPEQAVELLDDYGHHCRCFVGGSNRENHVYRRSEHNINRTNPGYLITANPHPAGNGSVTSRPSGVIYGVKLGGGPGSSGGGEFQVRLWWLWRIAFG